VADIAEMDRLANTTCVHGWILFGSRLGGGPFWAPCPKTRGTIVGPLQIIDRLPH
jgi:hypothetical protein